MYNNYTTLIVSYFQGKWIGGTIQSNHPRYAGEICWEGWIISSLLLSWYLDEKQSFLLISAVVAMVLVLTKLLRMVPMRKQLQLCRMLEEMTTGSKSKHCFCSAEVGGDIRSQTSSTRSACYWSSCCERLHKKKRKGGKLDIKWTGSYKVAKWLGICRGLHHLEDVSDPTKIITITEQLMAISGQG